MISLFITSLFRRLKVPIGNELCGVGVEVWNETKIGAETDDADKIIDKSQISRWN